jgi:DNA-binding YbaB/EbfC family protein
MADFPNMPDLGGLMQAAQRMQEDLQRAQRDLETKKVEATAGGGMVTAVVSGRLDLVSIKIDASVIDPKDTGMLQDLVVAAVNQALTKAKAMAQAELAKATGGLSLPGMPPIV